MNWKKLLLIGALATGFVFVAAPRSQAGVSVGIGIGVPVGYGYPYGYGGRYGYRERVYSSYGYGYSPYGYYRPGYVRVVVRPHYHWRHGHRYYCTARHGRWR